MYVTGVVGAAAAGLEVLSRSSDPAGALDAAQDPLARSFLYPEPRIRIGTLLSRNRAATACMDLSDGLADAVWQVAEASGVGAAIEAAALPIHPDARHLFEQRGADPVVEALVGGDDYELLFASRPRLRGRLRAVGRHADAPITRIGVFTAESGVRVRRSDGGGPVDTPAPRGFSHFK
jgi:thiamine-monophosphate kinase